MKFRSSLTRAFSAGLAAAETSTIPTFTFLLRRAYSNWNEDNGLRLAAALGFYALLALTPLVVIVVAIAGIFFGQRSVEVALIAYVHGLVGLTGAQALREILQQAHEPAPRTFAGAGGLLVLIFSASAVFVELQDALDFIWRVRRGSEGWWGLIRDRFWGFGLVLMSGVVLLALLCASTLLTALEKFGGYELPRSEIALHLATTLISVAVATLVFATIFKILPRSSIAWSDVWLGALMGAILFEIGKLLLALYLGKGAWTSIYGAGSSLVILVVWVYYCSIIVYFSAEFTKVYAELRGSRKAGGLSKTSSF